MRESDWLDLAELYGELWPHSRLPTETIQAWCPLVLDLERSEVAAALAVLALQPDRRYGPVVGEIRATVLPPPRRWEDAFAELRDVARAIGAYRSPPRFADPLLQRLVEERGWRDTCLATADDTTYRAQFRDAYLALQRAREIASARHAAGLPTRTQRTALPSRGGVAIVEQERETATLSVAQALASMREALAMPHDEEGVDLSLDDPAIPSSPAERRARAARARRRVAEARERWAREEGAR